MSDPSPDYTFHQQVADERERRGLTQAEAADAVGMSLRSYRDFELGVTKKLRPRNRRSIAAFFDVDADGIVVDGVPHHPVPVDQWPADIQVYLNVIGAFLMTMDEHTRMDWMREESRRIVGNNETRAAAARIAQEARERVASGQRVPIDHEGRDGTVTSARRRAGGPT